VDHVKICPTCGAENVPTAARCACGAFLIGVDLVERSVALAQPLAEPAREVEPPSQPDAAAPVSNGQLCAFEDCAQSNPAGVENCVYCNRPLPGRTLVPAPPPKETLAAPVATASPPAAPVESPARRMLISLPAGLNARFEIEQPLKAAGGEADLFIVRELGTDERAVLKLYRHGIEPRTDVLERVSRANPEQLVRLIEHGRDEGVPYELLEYCEHGSLRTLFKGKPLPDAAARTLLLELTDAIAHLHDCGIVHRDLKPENVLVRGLLPLDLVLTDFGISSVTEATMHYTSAARTLRYSAPEAGSNWVGRPTDYWALGMMLVEALTGRHPFEGLSEAVIAHWLVTRPIDVSAVTDTRWQRLCRGLLTRDPKERWGADEIQRWLAGDETLLVAVEQAAPVPGEASPYRVGETECRSAQELAVALAANWSIGVKDLKRGMLRAWLQNDLRDQNLARAAADAEEALDCSDDERLLKLLRRLDPELPAVFKGHDVSVAGLAALTRQAMEASNEARQTVFEILERRLASLFPDAKLQEAMRLFEASKAEFEQAIARAIEAGASRTLAPEGREWQLRMVLFALEPPKALTESLRTSARRVGGRAAQRIHWYRSLGDIETAGTATLAAMVLLGPAATLAGLELEREGARWALETIAGKIECHPALLQIHGEARERLQGILETSQDEAEVLEACTAVQQLDSGVDRSIETLFRREVFDARSVDDAQTIRNLRRRIGDWAAWRAGQAWQGFGDQVEIVAVLDRRSYRIELATQIETRRIAYKYGVQDVARMPPAARATLEDVWSCRMPALPQFGADLKLIQPQEVRCPRCRAVGRAELHEAWGSMAYPFSTTFACGDKAGVQCQTRIGRAGTSIGVPGVPSFVAEFIDSYASLDPAPERTLQIEAARILPSWLERIEPGTAAVVKGMLDASSADVKPNERVTRQRLRVTWTGVTEVRYRHEDREYRIWLPERIDATPIALEHPLPSESQSAPTDQAAGAVTTSPSRAASSAGESSAMQPEVSLRTPSGSAGGMRSIAFWFAILAVLGVLALWALK